MAGGLPWAVELTAATIEAGGNDCGRASIETDAITTGAMTGLLTRFKAEIKTSHFIFIEQVALARRERRDLLVFRIKLPLAQTVYHTRLRLHSVPYNADRQARKL